jgi:signal transduction histidine kinase/ActR/RegA family two-component response regulator
MPNPPSSTFTALWATISPTTLSDNFLFENWSSSFSSLLIFLFFQIATPFLDSAHSPLWSLINFFTQSLLVLSLYFILQKNYLIYLPSCPCSVQGLFFVSDLLIILLAISCGSLLFGLSPASSSPLDLHHSLLSISSALMAPHVLRCHHLWSVLTASSLLLLQAILSVLFFSLPFSTFLIIVSVLILQVAILCDTHRTSDRDYHASQLTLNTLTLLQNENTLHIKKCEEMKALLGNVAHDLKSPLQSFQLELESLSLTDSNQPQEQTLDTISLLRSSVDFMLVMINRTLDYTKTASGMKLTFLNQTMDLHEAMVWVRQLCNRSLSPVPIHIASLPEDLCSHIITDPQWFKENLLCLVSNAQKFSPEGEITLRCVFSPGEVDMIRVEVEDSGIGIPDEKMEQLFQPFQQAQLMAGGTGLGLFSLSKRIECLGGTCGVKKRDDGANGSCFWFAMIYRPDYEASKQSTEEKQQLPQLLEIVTDDKEEALSQSSSSPVLLPPQVPLSDLRLNILLVEDSLLIQKTSQRTLAKEGHTVHIANNGLECLKMVQMTPESPRYDIILMDLHMPVMDGLEATRRIRALEKSAEEGGEQRLQRHLIIGLSANSDLSTSEKALSVGMDDFLAKPLRIVDLNSCLRRCFSPER